MRFESNIWKLNIFKKISKNEANCKLCEENGENKFTFTMGCGSTSGIVAHLKAKHRGSDFFTKYDELERG